MTELCLGKLVYKEHVIIPSNQGLNVLEEYIIDQFTN